ncbi:GerW family sporulation protein [Oceanirhabdus sp. W0125-5]|uniref:GerW family sporulation protein n=1 Tax=Oceanirhabdus sp. W0125-5 TaxID=2999116 RepID=UPI0022F2D12C|nr:GerW family sporulation protein [Oceanirhabdus sp. W0125-5]WBW95302.1 GerW family sporulation protein [Oceanirhabdus sp. W0125-5]
MDHPIDTLMKHTMEELKNMVDVNTIVGTPVTSPDGTVIIPISKVSFAFLSGGSEFGNKTKNKVSSKEGTLETSNCCADFPFGGGSGAGVSLKPVAFLVVKDTNVRLLNMESQGGYDKILESIPDMFNFVKDMFKKDSEDKDTANGNMSKKSKKRDKKIHDKTIHDEKFAFVDTDTN